MKVEICIPSYRRSEYVESYHLFPNALYYVHQDEADKYRGNYPDMRLKIIPNKLQGNIATIRNFILDTAECDILVMANDDIEFLAYYENNKRVKIESEEGIVAFVYKYSQLAMELGVKLWGVNVAEDKQFYREYTPFSFKSIVLSPFCIHLNPVKLRYDERFPLKEDYDFFIQNILHYRKVLRINKWHYAHKIAENPGGCAVYRNLDKERSQVVELQKKWGSDIVRFDLSEKHHGTKKARILDYNPVIHIPIGGV